MLTASAANVAATTDGAANGTDHHRNHLYHSRMLNFCANTDDFVNYWNGSETMRRRCRAVRPPTLAARRSPTPTSPNAFARLCPRHSDFITLLWYFAFIYMSIRVFLTYCLCTFSFRHRPQTLVKIVADFAGFFFNMLTCLLSMQQLCNHRRLSPPLRIRRVRIQTRRQWRRQW